MDPRENSLMYVGVECCDLGVLFEKRSQGLQPLRGAHENFELRHPGPTPLGLQSRLGMLLYYLRLHVRKRGP